MYFRAEKWNGRFVSGAPQGVAKYTGWQIVAYEEHDRYGNACRLKRKYVFTTPAGSKTPCIKLSPWFIFRIDRGINKCDKELFHNYRRRAFRWARFLNRGIVSPERAVKSLYA